MWSHCHRLTLYKAKGVSIQHIGKRIARDDPGWCIILGFCYISDDQWKGVSSTSRSSSVLMSVEIRCSKKQKVTRKVVKCPLGCFVIMFHPHVSISFTSPGTRAPAPRGRCRIRRAFALGRVGARRRMASSGSAAGRIAGAVRPGSAGRHRQNGTRIQ